MLNIALPKGRLGNKVYSLFAEIGYDCKDIFEDNRKLIFENEQNGVRYFLVKPSNVAIYVERGAADIGVVGKDILLESKPDVYELFDLKLGKCKMAVAAKNGFVENNDEPLRVATKFVNIAKEYYNSINREIDVIKLNGSIELAPILDMSDVIVDIVETGKTLKENDLRVYTEIMDISARFIANKNAFRFKNETIMEITKKLSQKIG